MDIKRTLDERPDFLRFATSEDKNSRGTVVGIEHFRVDHLSNMRKNNKYQSLGIIHQKRTNAYYNKWREQVLSSEVIPEESLSELCDMLSRHFNNSAYATIHTFISSFKQAIDTHMKSIDEYARAINSEARKRNADHKLIILIEVHSAFRNLYFHCNGKKHYEGIPVVLVLEEIVSLLQQTDKRVDYYVLSFSDTLNLKTQTIAIDAKNIRGSLNKMHIPVYHYCGADLFLPEGEAFVRDYQMEMQHEEHGEEITFKDYPAMSTMRPEYKLKFIYNALRCACYYLAKQEPVVLDYDTERMLDVLEPFIISWRKCKADNWSYEPVFLIPPTFDYIDKAFKEFDKRWNTGTFLKQNIDL